MGKLVFLTVLFSLLFFSILNGHSFPRNWKDFQPVLLTPLKIDGVIVGDIWINPNQGNIILDKNALIQIFTEVLSAKDLEAFTKSEKPYLTKDGLSSRGLDLTFDQNELILYLKIPNEKRKSNALNIFRKQLELGERISPAPISAYLNFDYGKQFDNYEEKSETLYNELNINLYQNILNAGGHYNNKSDNRKYIREYTRYIRDFETIHSRLILGDLEYNTVDLQEQIAGAGITFQNDFSIKPTLLKTNQNNYEINLKSPSEIEVFLNNNRLYRGRHGAGLLNLKSLPLVIGQNTIKVIITDFKGKKETLYFSSNHHSNLLPKGVFDYSANFLTKSELNDESELEYNDKKLISSGYLRYGLNESLTLGLNVQTYNQNSLAGFEYTKGLGSFLFELQGSSSQNENNNASSFLVGLQSMPQAKLFQNLSMRATYRNYQEDFTSVFGDINQTKDKIYLSGAYTLNSKSSLGLSYDATKSFTDDELNELATLEYLHRINGNMNFSIKGQKDISENENNSIFFSFNWNEPTQTLTGYHSHQSQNHLTKHQVNYHSRYKSNNIYVSAGYDQNHEQETDSSRLFSQYESNIGSLRLDHIENDGNRTSNANLRFAFAATNNSFNLSKYINGSFLVLKSNSMNPIHIGNQSEDSVSQNQSVIRTNLTPYTFNRLVLDINELPFGEELTYDRISVRPSYKSGSVYKIKTQTFSSVALSLISPEGKRYSYQTGVIEGKDFKQNFMTGKNGKTFIPNIFPGKYSLKIDGIKNVQTIVVPKKKGFINLGEVQFEN